MLDERKKQNLKYSTVALPNAVNETHGYHLGCYRRFMALSQKQREKMIESSKQDKKVAAGKSKMRTRSSITAPKPTSNTGVFPSVCLFCCSQRKKFKGVDQKLLHVTEDSLQSSIEGYAKDMNDEEMLIRMSTIDFSTKEVKYHKVCRTNYQNRAYAVNCEREKKNPAAGKTEIETANGESSSSGSSNWHTERHLHNQAFQALKTYIGDTIVDKKEVHLLSDLNSYYESILRDIGGPDAKHMKSSAQRLEKKIHKKLPYLAIEKGKTKRGNVVYLSTLSKEEALRKQYCTVTKDNVQIRNIALKLREAILEAETKKLPENLTLEDIKEGEVKVPEVVNQFMSYVIGGPDKRKWKNTTKKVRIQSLGDDLVFCSTSGLKKPRKHLELSVALKSLTGSKKTVRLMNKLGHCASYTTEEELETELTIEANKNDDVTPFGMERSADSGMGCAWDNYDRNVETVNGDATPHDTVGIAYQTVSNTNVQSSETNTETPSNSAVRRDPEIMDSSPASDLNHDGKTVVNDPCSSTDGVEQPSKRKKRKRTYEATGLDIPVYRKKPKMVASAYVPLDDQRRKRYEPIDDELLESWKKDILWMADVATNSEDSTPMWVGWNASLLPRDDTRQVVEYVKQINQSPTSHSVVIETLRRSKKLAAESNKKSIVVTYDLAIAKMAMSIQAEESPEFDDVFVALGSFHIELAFFSACGKIINESGAPHFLNELEILKSGSLNGFIKGKSYNRCKRVHEYLSLAMESLHFEALLQKFDYPEEMVSVIRKEIERLKKDPTAFEYSREIEDFFQAYDEFSRESLRGEHGKTGMLWMQYIDMIHLYREFTRSVRVGDIDAYIRCLPKLANYFFALNHPNYARWLVQYHNNLLLLQDTHPEVYAEF